jgi:hypothetical protein
VLDGEYIRVAGDEVETVQLANQAARDRGTRVRDDDTVGEARIAKMNVAAERQIQTRLTQPGERQCATPDEAAVGAGCESLKPSGKRSPNY